MPAVGEPRTVPPDHVTPCQPSATATHIVVARSSTEAASWPLMELPKCAMRGTIGSHDDLP